MPLIKENYDDDDGKRRTEFVAVSFISEVA
jgi:hypothetical protein